jgi:hypothetical protein
MTSLASSQTEAPPQAPERPDSLYEVVGTQIVETPAMAADQAGIATLLVELLGPWVPTRGLGRVLSENLYDLRPAVEAEREIGPGRPGDFPRGSH